MDKLYILFNGETSLQHGALLLDMPLIESAQKRYSSTAIAGLDGEMIENEDTRSNVKITCTFSLLHRTKDKVRELKRWLDTIGDLQICDSLSWYYKVLLVEYENLEYVVPKFGTFKVTFTVYPYEFLLSGKEYQKLYRKELYNAFQSSFPIYKIKGEGLCELKVNDSIMQANVSQNLIIDTFLQLAYKEDGTSQNTLLKGKYKDIRLLEGINTIEISKGFELEITPNWGLRL